jgi:hypothetical protein
MHFSSLIPVTCPVHLLLLVLITLVRSKYYEVPHYAVLSSLILFSRSSTKISIAHDNTNKNLKETGCADVG